MKHRREVADGWAVLNLNFESGFLKKMTNVLNRMTKELARY